MRVIAILVGVIVGCFPVIGASKGYEEYGDSTKMVMELLIRKGIGLFVFALLN
mgnify:CR=1 FL=1